MTIYIVNWAIDIEANSHEEAADKAFTIMQDPNMMANTFTVVSMDEDGDPGESKLINGHLVDVDICGFCGKPGTDKIPQPVRWPGEQSAGTEYIHADCEEIECRRAHARLSDKEREDFLKNL